MGVQRQKWTAEEEETLKAGVAKHGIGKWKNILTDPDFAPSLANRSNIDLKDKSRHLDLSRKLTSEIKPPASKKSKTCPAKITTLPSSDTTRRSSRLTTIARVDYAEKVCSLTKATRGASNTKIHLKQGSEPEIYTAEHEKLLGDCKTKGALYVDGCDKHGKTIYDPIDGKCCHQCRQKTIGRHTECSSCKTRSGEFCGDCLFMRYDENVVEVNKNSEWICPVCRGICNCSRCRLQKGWKPTGSIYRKRKRASMVGGKRRGRPRKQTVEKSPVDELSQHNDVESKKNEPAATEYEQLKQQRIKENLQKMEMMGIFDLSKKLSSEIQPPPSKKSKTCHPKITNLPSSSTTRRSSRLTTIARVDYAEKVRSPTKAARGASNNKIHLKQGSEPEIYTAEHEKLFDGKSHGPDWLVGRHGKIVNLTDTPDITEPYVEELTTKIRQNLESDMEAKVNKKVQENITWILKKLEAVNPNMNFDIGDICATTK